MELLQTLAGTPLAAALRQNQTLYIFANAGHILSLALLVGAIVTLDLRILGLFGETRFSDLGPPLARVAATGLVLAVITGVLLFSVRPDEYLQNPAFLTKLGLVAVGIANAVLLHTGRPWRAAVRFGETGRLLRAAAVLSLAVWAGAILAGRWIGFLQ